MADTASPQNQRGRIRKTAFSTLWSVSAKITGGVIKLISIPLLLGFYGEVEYGLVVLAMSLSGYMSITALGLPTGLVRHASIWMARSEYSTIGRAAQSSFTFYGTVGILNAIVFISLAWLGIELFNVPEAEVSNLRWIFVTAGVFTLFTWPFSMVEQLLAADEQLSWLAKINVIQEVSKLLTILAAISAQLPIWVFFTLFMLASRISIPMNIKKWKNRYPAIRSFFPSWYWTEFKEVLSFSIGLFIIGASMASAIQLRPLILAARCVEGVSVAAEYQILFGISGVLVLLNGVLLSNLLPITSKAVAEKNVELLELIIYKVTRVAWVFMAGLIFGLITVSDRLLEVYVGTDYAILCPWLNLWLGGFMFLYLAPIAGVVMGTGRIRALVVSSPVAAVIALACTWILAPRIQVGAAAVGICAYYSIQFIVYHAYYLPRVLRVSPWRLLGRCFLPSVAGGLLMVFIARGVAWFFFPERAALWLCVAIPTGALVYLIWTQYVTMPLKTVFRFLQQKESTA